MTSYRTVIAFKFPEAKINEFGTTQYVETIKYLPIDYLDSRSVNASSQIVTQPLQSGDTMADHMYRLPTTVDLTATAGRSLISRRLIAASPIAIS